MTKAVVFAYHNVGVRCLSVLLAHGVEVPLILTHRDDPREQIWFESVAALATRHGLPFIAPENANAPEIIDRVRSLAPDFLFSFYYRNMLKAEMLATARLGAFNMHGSLLPKYRGRVPVNWAVIRGERETGATLHEMVEKPDAGRIVDQQAIPILPDDTAFEVFNKVTVAAEMVLDRSYPALAEGRANLQPQDFSQGGYFGGRKPEDGRIDWTMGARQIHDLVRGVAPPYPGAFTFVGGKRLGILRTLQDDKRSPLPGGPGIYRDRGQWFVDCADGKVLRIVELDTEAMAPGDLGPEGVKTPLT